MFGAGPQGHNGYVMSRLMPHFDLHAGPDLRVFSEFKFDYIAGRNGGPRGVSLRVGRQEVVFGSGRLFDNNEGP
jgi:hypothetical protein